MGCHASGALVTGAPSRPTSGWSRRGKPRGSPTALSGLGQGIKGGTHWHRQGRREQPSRGSHECHSIRRGRIAGPQISPSQLRHGFASLLSFKRHQALQRHCRHRRRLSGARQARPALRVALFELALEGSGCVEHHARIWRRSSLEEHSGSSVAPTSAILGAQHVIEPGPAESVAPLSSVASLSAVAAEAVVLCFRRAG